MHVFCVSDSPGGNRGSTREVILTFCCGSAKCYGMFENSQWSLIYIRCVWTCCIVQSSKSLIKCKVQHQALGMRVRRNSNSFQGAWLQLRVGGTQTWKFCSEWVITFHTDRKSDSLTWNKTPNSCSSLCDIYCRSLRQFKYLKPIFSHTVMFSSFCHGTNP